MGGRSGRGNGGGMGGAMGGGLGRAMGGVREAPGGAFWGVHTITLNLTLTFVASWFGHASHVDFFWLNKIMAASLLYILDPNTNSDHSLGLELG